MSAGMLLKPAKCGTLFPVLSCASTSRGCKNLLYGCKWFSSAPPPQYYRVLGLEKSASASEIKSAYYELSKKYHPDRNKDENSVEMFQKITEAYEILSKPDTKKAYDLSIQSLSRKVVNERRSNARHSEKSQKSYTDLDIDYKDFEHFQQSTRRRQTHKKDTVPEYTSVQNATGSYKSQRVLEREREELRIAQELQERERRARHPVPTFDQLCRQKEESKKREDKQNILLGIFSVIGILIGGILTGRRST